MFLIDLTCNCLSIIEIQFKLCISKKRIVFKEGKKRFWNLLIFWIMSGYLSFLSLNLIFFLEHWNLFLLFEDSHHANFDSVILHFKINPHGQANFTNCIVASNRLTFEFDKSHLRIHPQTITYVSCTKAKVLGNLPKLFFAGS